MPKTMLINVTHVEESRVAILEDGALAGYEIETVNRANVKGNIYNAVVETVHPALEAAFVRIAPDLKGFLPLDEVNFRLLPQRGEDRSKGKIGQHLHAAQRLIVQAVREPFGGKPPTVSTYFSLPGRYLVLMPGVDSQGISRKIEDATQRERLKKIVDELDPPEGFGVIVRTAGIGQTKAELQRDLRYLLRLWESIQRSSGTTEFPGLIYQERDLVIRAIRDNLTPDIDEVWIDNPDMFRHAHEFMTDVMPAKAKVLKLYTGDRPLFNKYNLEEQIERIYKRRVPLPSGGEIVIDGTEALTAIDVNSGRSARNADAEDNAVNTNLEAADEIARQLRLRDLGGLIVVDFIDMAAARNVKKVEKAVKDAMKHDRAKADTTRISKLGLMEISRQRIKGAKIGATYQTCRACDGYGLVKNVEAAGIAALRKLQTRTARGDGGTVRMALPPDVASWIRDEKRDDLAQLERRHGLRIEVQDQPELRRHEVEFETSARDRSEIRPPSTPPAPLPIERPPEAIEEPIPPAEEPMAAGAADVTETESEARSRRRRRRRGRGSGSRAPLPEIAPSEAAAPDPVAPPAAEELGGGDDGGDSEGGEPGRKRRRRRRRGKGGGSPPVVDPVAARLGSPATRSPAPMEFVAEEEPEPFVPRHVRSDELMPAATGRGSRAGGGGGRRGRGRRIG